VLKVSFPRLFEQAEDLCKPINYKDSLNGVYLLGDIWPESSRQAAYELFTPNHEE